MLQGKLTLIPTPISEDYMLHPEAVLSLRNAFDQKEIILVEDHKIARRRWLKWGLPREAIETFELYNEHNQKSSIPQIIESLKKGRNVYLMSDCGIPAFCDPGEALVDACHQAKIIITSTPFDNSIVLALALSGYNSKQFFFAGFVPKKNPEKSQFYAALKNSQLTTLFMDTPYHLEGVLKEIAEIMPSHEIFLGLDLCSSNQVLFRGKVQAALKMFEGHKAEFIAIVPALKKFGAT